MEGGGRVRREEGSEGKKGEKGGWVRWEEG